MKKKILLLILSLISIFACVLGLVGCNASKSGVNGTYYLYENDKLDKSQYITLSGSNWTDDDKVSGTFTLSGTKIVFYAEVFGSNEEMYSGTLANGVLTINVFGANYVYCKEGTKPSSSGQTPSKTQFTVTYNANGGTFANGEGVFEQNVDANSILTAPSSPTRIGSAFGGWSTSKNGSALWKFATDTVTKDLTLYAVWEEQSAAIISADGATIDEKTMSVFMLVDNTTSSVSLSNKIVCSSDSVWKLYYDKLGQTEIPTKIAAGKLGELSNGNNLFYIVVTSSNGSQVNVYELTVHRSYSVTISYYDNKDNLLDADSTFTGYEYTIDYTPYISGHTFNGWKNSAGTTVTSIIPYEAVKLYADCTANTYTAALNVNGGDALSTTEYSVTYDQSFSLVVPTCTGYTFNGWYYGSTQITDSKGKSLANWTYSTDRTLTADWTVNSYKVTLNRNNTFAGTVTGDGSHNYDSSVTISASTNNGYTWLGWYDKNDNLVTNNTSYTFKMGFATTYTAKWIACPVTVIKSISAAGTVSGIYGATYAGNTTTITAKTNSGYTWLGWYKGEELLTTALSYKFTMPSSSADAVTYTAKWACYTVTTATNDSAAGTYTVKNAVKTTAGSNVTLSATTNNGYTWLGWYDGETKLTDEFSYKFTMPDESVTYTAKWIEITVDRNDTAAGTVSSLTGTYKIGDYVTVTATTNSGYTWLGWYNGETKLTDELSYTFTMPTKNVTYTAKWTYYTVTALRSDNVAGSVSSYSNTKVTVGNNVTLKATINRGYTFVGWYNGETELTKDLSYTFTMLAENVTYTAKWEVNSELSNFTFTSTGTTCIITGIKDETVTEIIVPDYVTSISAGAFRGCSNLTSITLPFVGASKNGTTNTHFGYIFGAGSYSYNSSYVPTSLKSVIITSGNTIGSSAFSGCTSLESITIHNKVT